MTSQPCTYVESPQSAAARAVLLWIISRGTDTDDQLAALDAVGALEDHLPVDVVWATLRERPGSLEEARRLLEVAAEVETTPRGRVATSLAIGYLRRREQDR
jgi:hypothetical protein